MVLCFRTARVTWGGPFAAKGRGEIRDVMKNDLREGSEMKHIWLRGGGYTHRQSCTQWNPNTCRSNTKSHMYKNIWNRFDTPPFICPIKCVFLNHLINAVNCPPLPLPLAHTHNNNMLFCQRESVSFAGPSPCSPITRYFWILIGSPEERACNTLWVFSDLRSWRYYRTSDEWLTPCFSKRFSESFTWSIRV